MQYRKVYFTGSMLTELERLLEGAKKPLKLQVWAANDREEYRRNLEQVRELLFQLKLAVQLGEGTEPKPEVPF